MSNTVIDDDGAGMHDNFDELLHDRFRDVAEEISTVQEGLNEEATKFYKLVEEGKQELFPGCKNFTKLSFIIRLFLYKTLHGLSNVAFNDLLQLFQEVIPEAKLPTSFTQAKNIVKDLGLDYKKIPTCPNDCMLHWKDHEQDDTCHIYHTSKCKQFDEKQENVDDMDEEHESGGPIFVNKGHPIRGKKRRKGRLITLDLILREQAHHSALFNSDCAQVHEYINEHKVYIDTQPRKRRWARAQNHSHEFADWLKEKVKSNNVPDHIFWLAKGPSPTSKRYHGYYVNGYRFHTKSRDAKCHTQNNGVSITALTPSFASSRDKNPAVGDVDYYVLNRVPRDIYDLEDESSETIGDSYWSEPNEDRFNSFAQVSEHEIQLSRNDMPPLVVDANTNLDEADEANSDSGGDSDYDDTLWDWMEADEDEAH
ncbi:unnamed protein product [Lactuca virosa]|uniref:Transposase-associated domain-containing protein n=1 Tax=Lactuca virosa TaxID=75947 RepID=A0AAU9M9J5_9ASTR|nr:unnamed protein product [Lactuca virosa]